jgi:hypothetical protein
LGCTVDRMRRAMLTTSRRRDVKSYGYMDTHVTRRVGK